MNGRRAGRLAAVPVLLSAALLAAAWTAGPAAAVAAGSAVTAPARETPVAGAARRVTLTVRVRLGNDAPSPASVRLDVPLLSAGLDAYQQLAGEELGGAQEVATGDGGERVASYQVDVPGGATVQLVQTYRLALRAAGAWDGAPPGPSDLAAEAGVEAGDARLARLAAQLAEGAQDERTKAERILRYVHGRLRYEPASPAAGKGALAGFLAGSGTCTEYARLFVALARAAGVPARIVNGELLLDGAGRPATGAFRSVVRHEWAEFWQPGAGWIPVDPTFTGSVGRGLPAPAYVAENRGDRPVTGSAVGGRVSASVEIAVTAGW
ncbi:MAG: transglutaminase-like domain-containing protein [Bacillota bacterium]|nr:transglutaminase-like domain-containing protein [Bacillota bacterium]